MNKSLSPWALLRPESPDPAAQEGGASGLVGALFRRLATSLQRLRGCRFVLWQGSCGLTILERFECQHHDPRDALQSCAAEYGGWFACPSLFVKCTSLTCDQCFVSSESCQIDSRIREQLAPALPLWNHEHVCVHKRRLL